MATYLELKSLAKDSDLQDKTEVAVWIWAEEIITESPSTTEHAKRVTLARRIFSNPYRFMQDVLPALLAANKAVAVAGITGATDAVVQSAVDAVLDVWAPDLKVAGTE